MTPELITAVGWCAAALLGGLHMRTRQRLVLIARASHELRGPLSAARLGLGTIAAEPGRVAAIDLELARAGRALDDLAAAPSGTRPPDHRELIDLPTLARAYAPAWTTLAEAHGARFRLDIIEPATAPGAGGEAKRPILPTTPAGGTATRRRHLRAVPSPPDDPAGSQRGDRAVAGDRAPTRWRSSGPPPVPATGGRGVPVGAAVFADPFRVAQAVANLVANAAEHGGGVVRVRIVRAGERVWIEVADDGPGLPAPVAAMVASARSRRGRRGHGLAIASAIAEQLGGRLAAAPARAGARLVLDLPAAR